MSGASKMEAKAFRARWMIANEADRQELRGVSPREKLRRLAALMELAASFGWTSHSDAGWDEVSRRWNRLRRAAAGE